MLIFPPANQSFVVNMQACWFDENYWQQQGCIVGESRGRHITWFIQPPVNIDDCEWVLRHYYRGGLIAKITADQFVYSGLNKTRGFREIELLLAMREMRLPVPKAVGARIVRKGLFYRADLLMEKIDAKDMVAILKVSKLSDELWHSIGRVVALFHCHGIYHADLNAHNILMDDSNKVWLIDFDRCDKRPINSSWQQQNIQRLKRSLVKEKALFPDLYFSDKNWNSFIKGYQSSS